MPSWLPRGFRRSGQHLAIPLCCRRQRRRGLWSFISSAFCCWGFRSCSPEFSVGRATHRNAVGAYRALDKRWSFSRVQRRIGRLPHPGILFRRIGLDGRIHGSLGDGQPGQIHHGPGVPEHIRKFHPAIRGGRCSTRCLFVLATHFVIALGVQKGIERSAKVLMPLLFVILIALAIHSLLMPGGGERDCSSSSPTSRK